MKLPFRLVAGLACATMAASLLASCTTTRYAGAGSVPEPSATEASSVTAPADPSPAAALLPGMPPPLDPHDVYAADRPGRLSPRAVHDRPLVYVPNFGSGTVT